MKLRFSWGAHSVIMGARAAFDAYLEFRAWGESCRLETLDGEVLYEAEDWV